MKLQLTELRHPKDGYTISYSNLINTNDYLKVRDPVSGRDRDYCVYRIIGPNGRVFYIGRGRYYDWRIYNWYVFWNKTRPFIHKNDVLCKVLGKGWTIEILVFGLSINESAILEALFIREQLWSGRTLMKRGTYDWNGYSLINKNRGMSDETYETMSKIYLKSEWR